MAHRKEPQLGTQVVGIGGNRPQCFGGCAEEQAIDDRFVLVRDRRDRRRHREDDTEIVDGKQVGGATDGCG